MFFLSTRFIGLNHVVEEILYPAMEDYQIDIMIGQGPSARSIKLPIEALHADWSDDAVGPADVTACATASAMIFRPRLLFVRGALTLIPKALGGDSRVVQAEPEGLLEIARRSRGTPRIANRLLAPGARLCPSAGKWGDLRRRSRKQAPAYCYSRLRGLDKMDTAIRARDHR